MRGVVALLLGLAGALIAGLPALAESAVGMADTPCSPPPPTPPSVDAFNRAFLEPGKPDIGKLAALTREPEYVAFQAAKADQDLRDPNGLCRYAVENARLVASGRRPRLILFGDSITENWVRGDPALFVDGRVLGRGVGGQTSAQMLVRFHADVIALGPKVVQIMAGTNDVAGNGGLTSPEAYRNNVRAMVEIARAHEVRPVLASLTPARGFFWRPQVRPAARIVALNAWLRAYAAEEGLQFVDYHSALADSDGGMRAEFAIDGVHPNRDAYAAMRPLLQALPK